MNILAGFIAKFYEAIIVVLLAIVASLSVALFLQSTKLKLIEGDLKTIKTEHAAELAKQKAEMLKDLADANKAAAKLAEQYELEKSKRKIEYKTIYKEAENVKKDAVFNVDCISDDGVQLLNKGVKAYNPS